MRTKYIHSLSYPFPPFFFLFLCLPFLPFPVPQNPPKIFLFVQFKYSSFLSLSSLSLFSFWGTFFCWVEFGKEGEK